MHHGKRMQQRNKSVENDMKPLASNARARPLRYSTRTGVEKCSFSKKQFTRRDVPSQLISPSASGRHGMGSSQNARTSCMFESSEETSKS